MCLLITYLAGLQACGWSLKIIFHLDMRFQSSAMETTYKDILHIGGEVSVNHIFLGRALKFYEPDKIYLNQ